MSDEDRQPPFEARLAGIVLQDCEHALHMLRQNPRGAEWRVTWCSILTLLRAVGHVLERDVKAPDAAPEMRKAWQEWFKRIGASKPEPPIFWQFIKNDRDALLKEYRASLLNRASSCGGEHLELCRLERFRSAVEVSLNPRI